MDSVIWGGGLDDEYADWVETMLECGLTPVGNHLNPSKTDEVKQSKKSNKRNEYICTREVLIHIFWI
jgi:hypothetical protein